MRQTGDSHNDKVLVRKLLAGDEAALEALYARYAQALYAYIVHQLDGARADAEELWQDTWLAALEALSRWRGEGTLFTWLCGIARHKVLDHLRRKGRQAALVADAPPEGLAELMDAAPLPEEWVAQRATRSALARAWGTLPCAYRSALLARYVEGCAVAQVAERLQRSYKATESLLSRAREALRRALAEAEQEADDAG